MDAAPTEREAASRQRFQTTEEAIPQGGGRLVDVETRTRSQHRQQKGLISRNFLKPSDGLEPSTPSLPSHSCGSEGCCACDRLPPIATTGLHKGSIIRCQSRRRSESRNEL